MSYNVFPAPSADIVISPGLGKLIFGGAVSKASYTHNITVPAGNYVFYAYNELNNGIYDVVLNNNNKSVPVSMGGAVVVNLTTSETNFIIRNTKTWQTLRPLSLSGASFGTTTPRSITFGNNLYVMVGNNGRIATSIDLISWTSRTSNASSNELRGVRFGNGVYVTVGNASTIRSSTDGITWTTRTSPVSSNYTALDFGDGIFVAGGGAIANSTDGITWATSVTGQSVLDIVYGEKWVAVGSSNYLATSTNGISWTSRTGPFPTTSIHRVAYGNNIYVCVGDTGQVATSTDGITWDNRSTQAGFGTSGIDILMFGNGVFMACSGAGSGNNGLKTSTDGINWETITTASTTSGLLFNFDGAFGGAASKFLNNQFIIAMGASGTPSATRIGFTGIPSNLALYESSLGTLN
jgi:hypothetical protein